MSNITIRNARPEDAKAVHRIYAHHVETGKASFEEMAPSVEEITERRQKIINAGAPYIVAEWNGTVHGFAYAGSFRPRSAYRHTVEDSIYVDPAATGKGIGSALLSGLIERCTQLGYRQMVAVIGGADNLASINLHKRQGFEEVGHLKSTGFKFGDWVDTIIMQRPLGFGSDTLPDNSGPTE
ncbi:N-acetyltransferase family protein [Magnetovibrio sp. PR-2]|uniref:GNAT family N-acetyltransferase n=1 Tax=Magnetovibrio sp. PR-2 TaxID=3120356 RepID=UPI002FCE37AE